MRKDPLLDLSICFVFILTICLVYQVYYNKHSIVDMKAQEIHQTQNDLKDVIVKHDTVKLASKIRYIKIRDTIILAPDSLIDSMFNKTFKRDSSDTTKYIAGISQYRKALDSHHKFIRDSTSLIASDSQVKACTTAVTDIVKDVDVIVDEKNSKTPYLIAVAGVAFGLIVAAVSILN